MITLIVVILGFALFVMTAAYKHELRKKAEKRKDEIVHLYGAFIMYMTFALFVLGAIMLIAWFNVGYGRIIDKKIDVIQEEISVNRQYAEKYALDIEESDNVRYLDRECVNLEKDVSKLRKQKLRNKTWRWLAYFGGWLD